MNMEYIKQFYERHVNLEGSTASGDEIRTRCPYHDDNSPSFSYNISNGMYKCFSPNCKLSSGGSIYKFLSIVEDMSLDDAKKTINKEAGVKKKAAPKKRANASSKVLHITQDQIEQHCEALMNHPDRVEALTKATLWTVDTMKRFEIGYDTGELRYWIPIKENGVLKNVRKYQPGSDQKIIQITGHSAIRLYPYSNLQGAEIVIMEGEKDCILANQHGFNAVTVTGGAGQFNTEWKEYFIDRNVVICYDIDDAGIVGAYKVANILYPVAKSVKVVKLPITEPANGDYTDYVMQGHTPQDFRALIDETQTLIPDPTGPIEIPDTVHDTSLDRIAEERMFYKRARLQVRIIGKNSAPSIIPKSITVSCNRDNGKSCYFCDLSDCKLNTATQEVSEITPEILQLIECTNREKGGIIRDMFGIPSCRKFTIKENDHQGITRCSVIPSIDDLKWDTVTYNQKYVERDVFVLSDTVEANCDYEMEAIAMPDPKDQTLVHLVYATKPADSSIEEFKMTPELKEKLGIFQCTSETN